MSGMRSIVLSDGPASESQVMTDQIAIGTMRRIRPTKGWVPLSLKDLWEFRELLYFLIWRDVKVRYKQTALGVGWAIIQPLTAMVLFSVFFGWLVKVPSDGLPYPIFAYCALLLWQLFASALNATSNSLLANQHLITKVSFPRLVVPLSAMACSLLDFTIASVLLLPLMLFYKIAPTPVAWILPVFVLLTVATALGVGCWLSALSVRYRDVRHVLPFLAQAWMLATPIVYPMSLVPESWRLLYAINPMVGVVEGFRWALLGAGGTPGLMLLMSILVTLTLLLSGVWYFHQVESTFADVV
jgi:lipopolysaccharide transport system permease protein